MNKPNPSQLDTARRLLAREAEGLGSAEERAAAARHVYEEIAAHLATLVGSAAARALFARSVKVAAHDFPCLRKVHLVGERDESLGEQLEACVRGETPDTVTETAVALYATLLALLGKLIGDQLAAKVLRESSPAFRVRPAPPKGERRDA